MKVSIVVMTFNEIKGVKEMLPRIKKEWYDELVIVDGGSSDGTVEYAREQGYDIFRQKGEGVGIAFLEGFERTTGDVVILFAPDGNFIPEKIPELVAKIKDGYDLAIVSRYREGAKSYDDDPVTAFGNRMFTSLANILFGTRLTDLLYGYCAFKRGYMYELGMDTTTSACLAHFFIRAARKGLKIAELPGDEPCRIGGIRKMQPLRDGSRLLAMIIKEFFSRR